MTDLPVEDIAESIQGNILRGYSNELRRVRHIVLQVGDGWRARQVVAAMLHPESGAPQVTSGGRWPGGESPDTCVNLAFTHRGLAAIGLSDTSLASFPPEFRAGMVARASILGDVGESAPDQWQGGLGHDEQVHVIVTIHATSKDHIEATTRALLGAPGSDGVTVVGAFLDGRALTDTDSIHPDATEYAESGERRFVHFGYRDGVAQPRFEGISPPGRAAGAVGWSPLGTVLLGHPTPMADVRWAVPTPTVLGHGGTFNAFRVLQQDVDAFHTLITTTAEAHGIDPALVAAKMCGRYPNGMPLSEGAVNERSEISFANDPDGARCPLGSHIRRANPRDANIVQRATSQTRRLVRRGMPYGRPYDPEKPNDGHARGLLGNFLCADLGGQFEMLQYDWLNLGFQDPRVTGTNDPLVGQVTTRDVSRFAFNPDPAGAAGTDVVIHPPALVRTVGGAYTFLPSMAALAWIAAGGR